MLDNFSVEDTRKAVELIGGKFETESSGDITFDTLRDYAECGVNFISVGALTHSVSKRIRDAALYTIIHPFSYLYRQPQVVCSCQ